MKIIEILQRDKMGIEQFFRGASVHTLTKP